MTTGRRKCIRCFFSGERLAADEIRVTYGAAEYILDLCTKHAQDFDDAMWGWLRSAREVETPFEVINGVGLSERLRNARQIVEPITANVGRQTPAQTKSTIPSVDVLALKWSFSDHAMERLEERGPLHGFGIKEALEAAEAPEHSRSSKRGDGTWYRIRGKVAVIVNAEERTIVTVLSPKEYADATTARTA